jgi:hypothetical protein
MRPAEKPSTTAVCPISAKRKVVGCNRLADDVGFTRRALQYSPRACRLHRDFPMLWRNVMRITRLIFWFMGAVIVLTIVLSGWAMV